MNGLPLEYDQAERLKNNRMKQMLNWIHLHYAEKVTLDDIAQAGQLSRSECCRYFKRMLKNTPLSYVMEYRIQQYQLFYRTVPKGHEPYALIYKKSKMTDSCPLIRSADAWHSPSFDVSGINGQQA